MQGSFVKKRGKTWTAFYYEAVNGKRTQHSKGGFRTKGEARDYLAEVVTALRRGEPLPSHLTVRDYLEQRWFPIMERRVRPTTFDSYTRQLRLHLIPVLGDTELQRLRAEHFDELYATLLDSGRLDGKPGGLSVKSIRYLHTTIHKSDRGRCPQGAASTQRRR